MVYNPEKRLLTGENWLSLPSLNSGSVMTYIDIVKKT